MAINKHGFKIAIDNFGAEAASLVHLLTMPTDIIKIDRSWVSRLASETSVNVLIEGLLHVAKGLGIGIIAQGIETNYQADLLLEGGCRLAQGFLYSRPIPPKSISTFLQTRAQARKLTEVPADLNCRPSKKVASNRLRRAG